MGIHPENLTVEHTGVHLTPEEFHKAFEKHVDTDDRNAIFVDCRNFYESKIVRLEF
jgi:predicted sulfurtransferase